MGHGHGLDAGHAEFGGFFHQPVHAFVGRHPYHQVHGQGGFTFGGVVCADLHLHVAAAHTQHGGVKLAAVAVEQRQQATRLQPQHLHMARRARRQVQLGTGGQGDRAVETGHYY